MSQLSEFRALMTMLDTLSRALALPPGERAREKREEAAKRKAEVESLLTKAKEVEEARADVLAELAEAEAEEKPALRQEYNELGKELEKLRGKAAQLVAAEQGRENARVEHTIRTGVRRAFR